MLFKQYNQDSFHIQHALTMEAVMGWFAKELGYADESDFWSIVGMLHDIDFEQYPEEHCLKAPELLRNGGVDEDMIHAVWLGVAPLKECVEKVDEILGLDRKLHAFALIPVGYPAEDRPQQDRFDESRIHYIG